jgi:3-dehydroquinate synthetase
MQKIDVKLTHKNYPIYIENGLFKKAGSILSEFLAEKKVIYRPPMAMSSYKA